MAKITTITNPLTGQPTQVDQLDHTAQEIDDGIGFESTDYPGCYYRTVDGVVEWLNPPMVVGHEYRTTERFNGKPVYAKALTVGSLAANTLSVAASFAKEAENVVRAYAIATYNGSSLKTPQHGNFLSVTFTADGAVYSVNNQVRVNIKSSVDMTDCVAVAYYTKA